MWVESIDAVSGAPVLIDISSIKTLEKINGSLCSIDGRRIKTQYEDVKALILSKDVKYSDNLDFRLKHLLQQGILSLVNNLGTDLTVEYIQALMACTDAYQLIILREKYCVSTKSRQNQV